MSSISRSSSEVEDGSLVVGSASASTSLASASCPVQLLSSQLSSSVVGSSVGSSASECNDGLSASFVGDGLPALPGGNGNTPLATFGSIEGLAHSDALCSVCGRVYSCVVEPKALTTQLARSDSQKCVCVVEPKALTTQAADFADALAVIHSRLPKSLSMPAKIRKEDQLERLHLGFDTLEWSSEIGDDELARSFEELEYLAASNEPLDIDGLEVVVRRVGGISHCYLISTSLGLSVWVPKLPMYRLRVVASPKYILSQETEDLEERAAILVASLVRLDAIPVLLLSRVDVALDLLMPVSRFENIVKRVATKDSSVVRRARLLVARSEGNSYRSVQVGKSDVVLRIYDKMAEAVKTGDWDLWAGVYGPLVMPADYTVVRIEFQLRSGFLKQGRDGSADIDTQVPLFPDGLRSLAAFKAAAPAVLLYLTQAWFRFAGAKKGADNVRSTLGWWQSISNCFVTSNWYTFVADVWRDCKRVASKNLDRLVSMSAGCLSAVAAVLSYRASGEKVGVRDVLKYMFDYLMADAGEDVDRYEKWVDGRDKRYQSLRFGVKL